MLSRNAPLARSFFLFFFFNLRLENTRNTRSSFLKIVNNLMVVVEISFFFNYYIYHRYKDTRIPVSLIFRKER